MPAEQSQSENRAARQRAMPARKTARDIRIGQNIRAARGDDPGQAELARRIDVTATTMWRYESGYHCPIEKLEAIARELGVTVDSLLKGADEPAERAAASSIQEDYMRIASLALEAARDGSPDAQKRFEAAVQEHAARIRGR